jgi:hypothetical protein
MNYRELTQEEGEALTKDLQEVLEKHNAEMQTKTTIELVKRLDDIPENNSEPKAEESGNSNTK